MIRHISKFLKKTGEFIVLISDKILLQPEIKEDTVDLQSIRVKQWFKDNGDKTHRINYELNEESVVMDLGGYEGQWAADIFCRYACNIHIFEPLREFADNIQERFKRNSKVTVYNYGLSKHNVSEKLNISADSSSIFKSGEKSVEIQLVKIDDFLFKHNITHIDLMKINIEGGEYDLLEHLVQSEKILSFKNIQVQFHDFVSNAEARMHCIQGRLGKTHYLTYQYEFVWENWALKK